MGAPKMPYDRSRWSALIAPPRSRDPDKRRQIGLRATRLLHQVADRFNRVRGLDRVVPVLVSLDQVGKHVSVASCISEAYFRRPDGSRNVRLDRISALIEVARRQTRALHNVMVDSYDALSGSDERAAA